MRTFTDARGRVHEYLGVRDGRACFRVVIPAATRLECVFDPFVGGDSATYNGSTDDKYILNHGTNYTTVRNAASGTAVNTGPNVGQTLDVDDYSIYRAAVFFDTSGLPDSAIVSAATLTLDGDVDGSTTDFAVTAVSFAGSRPPVTGDYDLFGTTSFGSFNTSAFSANHNDITLNAAGIAVIDPTGWTQYGLRSSRDIGANTPSGPEYVTFEHGAASHLAITYTLAILATCTLGFSAAIQATGLLDLLGAATLSFSAAISATPVLIHMGAATLSFSAGIDAASPLTVVIFAENPSWEKQIGAKPNRVRCRIAGGTTVKTATAGGVPAGEEIDYWVEVPAGTTESEAQSTADAVLAAHQARPISVAGPIPLRVGIDFAETILTEWWERTGATATKREAVALVVAKKEHDIAAGLTRISLGDYAPSTIQLIAQIMAKLSR